MAVSRKQKEEIMTLLLGDVVTQKAVVLLNTADTKEQLNSEENFKMRAAAHAQGLHVKVIKNTLITKAFENLPELVGPTYVVYLQNSEDSDEITAPKSIVNIVKDDFSDYFNIFGSVVNGEFLDKNTTVTLSKTPSFDDSMSSLAGMLNSITAKVAMGVKEVPASIARGVSAYSKQK